MRLIKIDGLIVKPIKRPTGGNKKPLVDWKVVIVSSAMLCLTGCAGKSHFFNTPDVSFEGNKEGVNAFLQGVAGIAKTAKEGNDSPNQYMQLRATEEREYTKRSSPSLWEKFVGKSDVQEGS